MFDLTAYDAATESILELRRHRLFESTVGLIAPKPCRHGEHQVGGVYGGGSSKRSKDRADRPKGKPGRGGYTPVNSVRQDLMGIDWMTGRELTESIPPAYTEHVGRQIMAALS